MPTNPNDGRVLCHPIVMARYFHLVAAQENEPDEGPQLSDIPRDPEQTVPNPGLLRRVVGSPQAEVTPLPIDHGERERQLLQAAVEGRYKIRRLLGRGGMSGVYLAWEHALEREVALKVLSPHMGRGVENRERFRREGRVMASLNHPNIVPVYTLEQKDGLTFAVMQYVQGESLGERLERMGSLPQTEAVRMLGEIADAVAAVHGAGVIHRDIKPDNILIDDHTGRAMLIDFGVATVRTSEHSRSEVAKGLGTPHYMSPEQALGEQRADERSDIYSLGVVGFRMVAGRLPFSGSSARSIVAQHVALEAPPVGHYAPWLDDEIARVIDRCLAKDPSKRWPDARAFRSALVAAERRRSLPMRMVRRVLRLFRR